MRQAIARIAPQGFVLGLLAPPAFGNDFAVVWADLPFMCRERRFLYRTVEDYREAIGDLTDYVMAAFFINTYSPCLSVK